MSAGNVITLLNFDLINILCTLLDKLKGLDKHKKFEHKIVNIFLTLSFKHMFWVPKRTVSSRRFF